jgi:hypothetical protein
MPVYGPWFAPWFIFPIVALVVMLVVIGLMFGPRGPFALNGGRSRWSEPGAVEARWKAPSTS